MATSLTLEQTTFDSKNITRSVTNISSTANDSQLYEFAEALNGLTTNTLNKVNRIDKREITNEEFYNLTVDSVSWGNDGKAGTHSGLTFTIPVANVATTTDVRDQTFLDITLKANNITVIPSAVTIDTLGINGCAQVCFSEEQIEIVFVSKITGSLTVTIPAGQVTSGGTVYKYNAATLTVNVTE